MTAGLRSASQCGQSLFRAGCRRSLHYTRRGRVDRPWAATSSVPALSSGIILMRHYYINRRKMSVLLRSSGHYTLHATRCTLHAARYTLLATRYTLHAARYTLHATRYTLHATRYTLHTTHYTLHTTHYTLHATHYTLHATHYTTRGMVGLNVTHETFS